MDRNVSGVVKRNRQGKVVVVEQCDTQTHHSAFALFGWKFCGPGCIIRRFILSVGKKKFNCSDMLIVESISTHLEYSSDTPDR
jgi:uncharacterized membrane-anchored protein